MKEVTINAFNASTQKIEPHVVTADANGELIFRAENGAFFKLPAGLKQEEIQEYLDKHEAANKGQISAEEIAKKSETALKGVAAIAKAQEEAPVEEPVEPE